MLLGVVGGVVAGEGVVVEMKMTIMMGGVVVVGGGVEWWMIVVVDGKTFHFLAK